MLLMPKVTRVLGVAFMCWFVLAGVSARGGSHLWVINEVFSNADGTIQFVEMYNCCARRTSISRAISSNSSPSC